MPRDQRQHVARRSAAHRNHVRRLHDVLRSNIVRGVYRESMMPSEAELMATHSVSRAVIREALSLLRDEGLVDRLQGYGTYALPAPRIDDVAGIFAHARSGFWDAITHTTVLARESVPTPDAVLALMPTAGERVLQLDYLAHCDREVVAVATNYFRYPEADAIGTMPVGTDFYGFLDRCGLRVGATEMAIGASVANENLVETMGISAGTPLLGFEQRIMDPHGETFDIAFVSLRADRLIINALTAQPGYPHVGSTSA